MNTDIFIVSYNRDFDYLRSCLKSIVKFATGFHNVVLMVPRRDIDALYFKVPSEVFRSVDVKPFDEWEGKGMLHHMHLVMTAPDYCPGADLILHTDSDCIFTEPVTPADYIVDGKPVLVHANFDWVISQQGNILNWKVAVQNAIGITPTQETMRRHPAVHYPEVYRKTQAMIEDHNKMPMAEYIKAGKNSFPQSFCEFNTLGAVAWEFFRDKYHWIDQVSQPWPKNKIKQFWSHAGVTESIANEFKQLGIA